MGFFVSSQTFTQRGTSWRYVLECLCKLLHDLTDMKKKTDLIAGLL